MPDVYESWRAGLDSPALGAFPVTPNDSTDLATTARALYVGGAGNVSIDDLSGRTAVVFTAVPAGMILPVRAKRVRATGTTATNIVALY